MQRYALGALQHRSAPAAQLQGAVAADVDLQHVRRHELAQVGAPERLSDVRPDAEGRQPVVAMLADLLRRLAAQHGDQMLGAESLSGPQRRRQRLLGDHRTVDCVPTGAMQRSQLPHGVAGLAEVAEQGLAAAARGFAQMPSSAFSL